MWLQDYSLEKLDKTWRSAVQCATIWIMKVSWTDGQKDEKVKACDQI